MFSEFRDAFLDLLAKLHRLRELPTETALCLEIQNRLYSEIVGVERHVGKLRKQIRETKSRVTKKLDKATSKHLLTNVSRWQERVSEYQKVLHAFRDIGDGIAFTYIDKWDIKPMAFKPSPGFVSGKAGTKLEREILQETFKRGAIAIQNDLTNCLRYGDITIPHEGAFQIIEAQSGDARHARKERQLKELSKISTYLQSDEVQGLYGIEDTVRRQSHNGQEVTWTDDINELIRKSYSDGSVGKKVEDGLYYHVAVDSNFDGLSKDTEGMEPGVAMMVNDLKFNNVAYFPFTLSISDPEHWYDFYSGNFLLSILVDWAVVTEKYEHTGWKADLIKDETQPWALHLVKAGEVGDEPTEIKISRHFWGRLAAEFVGLDWFIQQSVLPPPFEEADASTLPSESSDSV